MKSLSSHGKLLGLLWLVAVLCTSLVVLAGCGGLLSDQKIQTATPLQTYDQVVDSFNQIVPGMTNAQDLPNLGFDPKTADVDVLSSADVEGRFMHGLKREQLDPAVQDCIRARLYCTGYVFHPGHASGSGPADVTLLVMNGRVVHKVFSGTPRSET